MSEEIQSTMTDEHKQLIAELLQTALDNTDHPARAVSLLMSAAGTILHRSFGADGAVDLMQQGLDNLGAELRRRQLN